MALAPSMVVGCSSLLGLFLATVTHFELCASGPGTSAGRCPAASVAGLFLPTVAHFEPFASGPVAFADGWSLSPPGVFLATVTHSEPYASGPVAFVGSSLAAACLASWVVFVDSYTL